MRIHAELLDSVLIPDESVMNLLGRFVQRLFDILIHVFFVLKNTLAYLRSHRNRLSDWIR